jgi:hypothetical protein
VLLGTESYTILSRGTDTEASVYVGHAFGRAKGGRAMTVAADLRDVTQPTADGGYTLVLTDFWRIEGRGYIDRLEVALPEGMTLTAHQLEPPDATEPDRVGDRTLVWENAGPARAAERIHLTLAPAG